MSDLRPLVIYHDNCADGFGAAWAAYNKFGADGAEYLPMNYNDKRVFVGEDGKLVFPVDLEQRNVYILDFSFKPEIMEGILWAANHVTWIDHHKTAFEDRNLDPKVAFREKGVDWRYILDPNKSGCVLAWEHFNPELDIPEGLLFIEDRDLWKWEYNDTRDFATGLRSEPFSFNRFDRVMYSTGPVIEAGMAMNKLFDQQLADITKRPMAVDLYDTEGNLHQGLAVNCTPNFSSEAGNTLAKKSETFGMTWVLSSDGSINVSLRSIGNYDVSAIARNYGGGGHRNAAGFKVPFDKFSLVGVLNTTLVISK